ncbi:MAG: hypothetical protein EXR95_07970 [Gemmatimonadetes bacterium]|nr:hypothetical protein [Gemmatimonadota bacterium]
MSGLREAAALLVGLPGTGVAAQACPDGVVTTVFIDNHSIFDPEELAAVERFDWAYRLANRLHVRTRQGFIRRELLFEEGTATTR